MGKDKLIQGSKFYGDYSHAYLQAVNRHGHFGSGDSLQDGPTLSYFLAAII